MTSRISQKVLEGLYLVNLGLKIPEGLCPGTKPKQSSEGTPEGSNCPRSNFKEKSAFPEGKVDFL